jgi:hypothetical protein
MNGSSFQLEQSMMNKRFSSCTFEFQQRSVSHKNSKNILIVILTAVLLTVSATSFAGQSQPKIKGGNGNASGR